MDSYESALNEAKALGIEPSELVEALEYLRPMLEQKREEKRRKEEEAEAEALRLEALRLQRACDDASASCKLTVFTSSEAKRKHAMDYLKKHHPGIDPNTAYLEPVDVLKEFRYGIEMIEKRLQSEPAMEIPTPNHGIEGMAPSEQLVADGLMDSWRQAVSKLEKKNKEELYVLLNDIGPVALELSKQFEIKE